MKPDIPPDALARISPVLEALEAAFRPLAQTLVFSDEPALTFDPAEDAAE